MKMSDFDYDLPADLIAQEPARPRDSSRMLVLRRESGLIEHRGFRDLPDCLGADDVVVLNDTRVIPARLRGQRQPGGGKVEILLLSEREKGVWEALIRPAHRALPGRQMLFGGGEVMAEVTARTPSGGRLIRFRTTGDVREALMRLGEMPLPPYIRRTVEDESDYQTVYSRTPGAIAAPTAGLHFTPDMLNRVRSRAGAVATLTLHIGPGTFRPVRTEAVEDHTMQTESYTIPKRTVRLVSEALAEGRRVVAVGTSTARALEAAAGSLARNGAEPRTGEATIFIHPGYRFRVVSAMLTNFHLPSSTPLLMVCAFAGRQEVLRSYREAVRRRYRFLSFGDAMLIV
jgi:S-adenosylmethionine:tRNA ribosyltransferase-isomerase